jgi:soluble lytic murein transglycosylase-like protein
MTLTNWLLATLLITTPAPDTTLVRIVGDTTVARSIHGQVAWLNMWEDAHIDPRIIANIIRVESGGDSLALGALGEVGLGQIRPHLWLGLWPECGSDLWTVRTNVCYVIRIWRHMRDTRGSRHAALMAYNGCKPTRPCTYPQRVLQGMN